MSLPDTNPSERAATAFLFFELFAGRLPASRAEALEITGVSRSQAYTMKRRLEVALSSLLESPGRPSTRPADSSTREKVLVALYEFLMCNPGAACGNPQRRVYSDGFRRFVVGLGDQGGPGEGLSTAELAALTGVPLGTLKDWMRTRDAVATPASGAPECSVFEESLLQAMTATARSAQLVLVADLWQSWRGSFLAFCQMLRTEQRLPFSATFIGNFLQATGLRQRRSQTPTEAPWSSNTFRTLFPGAQWLGDGTTIPVRCGEQVFFFNLEAIHDPASDAQVGFAVTDVEDEEAVRQAFESAVATAGSGPLALSLDNRPSNHTAGVAAAVGDTVLLRSTPGRGQAKAPLEGCFGLFQQALPGLVLSNHSTREMARSALFFAWAYWCIGRNGKPRKRLQNLTPARACLEARPTPEQIQAAKDWFLELQRRQQRAQLTREARRDPVRLVQLTQGLAELGIPDPEGKLAVALAYYGREAITRGLSTFSAKQALGTLPDHADLGAYLGGIIRQLHTRLELERYSEYLLEQRVRLRDLTLAPLARTAENLRLTLPSEALPQTFTDHALNARWEVDFRYWGRAAGEALSAQPPEARGPLYRSLSRRIAATFKSDRLRREDLIDRLAQALTAAA